MKRKPNAADWVNITALLLLSCLFIWVGIEYNRMFGEIKGTDLVSSAENLKDFILTYGNWGIAVMCMLHALQVVVSFIPAAIVQFTGAAVYGFGWGMVIGIAGVAVGTTFSFYISRLLGRRVVELFVSKKNLDTLENVMSKDASALALFVLFVVPFPKDFIAYFVGLTNMKASRFFLISAVGRLPGMFVASYLGANIFDRNYAPLIIVLAFCAVCFTLAYIFRKRLLGFISKKH